MKTFWIGQCTSGYEDGLPSRLTGLTARPSGSHAGVATLVTAEATAASCVCSRRFSFRCIFCAKLIRANLRVVARVRVLLVDDHRAFSGALAALLDADPEIEVVGAVPSATAARAAVDKLRPDVALIDVDLGDGNGIDLVADLGRASDRPECVMLTCHDDVDTVVAAARAGVVAFVPKDVGAGDLIAAIHGVTKGDGWIPRHLLGKVMRKLVRGADDANIEEKRLESLTPREREILSSMMAGLDRNGIAETLGLSNHTVRTHIRNILAKLGAHSMLEAVAVAYRAGLQPTGPGSRTRHSVSS